MSASSIWKYTGYDANTNIINGIATGSPSTIILKLRANGIQVIKLETATQHELQIEKRLQVYRERIARSNQQR